MADAGRRGLLELAKSWMRPSTEPHVRGYIHIARQLNPSDEERMAIPQCAGAADRADDRAVMEVLGRYPSAASLAIAVSAVGDRNATRKACATAGDRRQDRRRRSGRGRRHAQGDRGGQQGRDGHEVRACWTGRNSRVDDPALPRHGEMTPAGCHPQGAAAGGVPARFSATASGQTRVGGESPGERSRWSLGTR